MKVSIQGERGSYHDLVANHIFGSSYESLYRGSFTEVFEEHEYMYKAFSKNGSQVAVQLNLK